MQNFQIYKNLARINNLPLDKAEAAFRDCCGSGEWARRIAAARPFRMVVDMFEEAESIWLDLGPADWLEAFAAHPKIGADRAPTKQQATAAAWSKREQAGMDTAADKVRDALEDANRLYEEKFGFIFIVCATGKTADEMLAICRARLGNSAETEMQIAAEEQGKITAIRLNKLLEQ